MQTHDYKKYASAYAKLDVKDTFYLGYRDIPLLAEKYAKGKNALDYGCGSGRSSRFLKKLGYDVIGVDHNPPMIEEAIKLDSNGDYRVIEMNDTNLDSNSVDLILVSLVLMEVESLEKMKLIFKELNRVLSEDGVIIIITDAEDMYKHESASFTYDFPENENIKSGDKVKLGFRGTEIVFFDYYWDDKDYNEVFNDVGLKVIETHQPLAVGNEPYEWISETEFPHFTMYVLAKT